MKVQGYMIVTYDREDKPYILCHQTVPEELPRDTVYVDWMEEKEVSNPVVYPDGDSAMQELTAYQQTLPKTRLLPSYEEKPNVRRK